MLVPSIDIQSGQAVQLVQGKEKLIDAGDPLAYAQRFCRVGEVAVIDLDAALSKGNNDAVIKKIAEQYPVRIGGGIRDLETAFKWLDAGARKIIIGTKAEVDFLRQLPQERVIVALDAFNGEIVTHGWTVNTGKKIVDRILELKDYVSGFQVTFVEKEGMMGGTNLDQVAEIVTAAGKAKVTIAGGVTTASDLAELDKMGADAQVGMALYSGKLSLTEAFLAPVNISREDGLIPTVVCNEFGQALGLVWSNVESVSKSLETGKGIYFSRRRGLWEKGKSSGNTQKLLKVELDCDRDALLFTVKQRGSGFCHREQNNCWSDEWGMGKGLVGLSKIIESRRNSVVEGSYTRRLFTENGLLEAKIIEEAHELIKAERREDVLAETADLIYFSLVRAIKDGISLAEISREFDKRNLKVSRRGGDAKVKLG
ncbi:MAG: phosphoribosyl-ATP diphosphatase [Proteobacteria bacterium]|nr:phosphoribosyl-ATP diphosphatase [Pseudomonadota bacterium]